MFGAVQLRRRSSVIHYHLYIIFLYSIDVSAVARRVSVKSVFVESVFIVVNHCSTGSFVSSDTSRVRVHFSISGSLSAVIIESICHGPIILYSTSRIDDATGSVPVFTLFPGPHAASNTTDNMKIISLFMLRVMFFAYLSVFRPGWPDGSD